MGWKDMLQAAGDIASIIVAVTAVGGAVWILIQRSATRVREIARSPRAVAVYRQAVAAFLPAVLIAGVVVFVEMRLDDVLAQIQVQSGVIVVSDAEAHESGLARPGNGECENRRGPRGTRVDFEERFAFKPEVLVSLTQIDQHSLDDTAVLKIEVTEVDVGGFNYDLLTWCNTRVARVRAEWIAVAR